MSIAANAIFLQYKPFLGFILSIWFKSTLIYFTVNRIGDEQLLLKILLHRTGFGGRGHDIIMMFALPNCTFPYSQRTKPFPLFWELFLSLNLL